MKCDVEAAYRAAIRLLGRRAHSRKELAQKLRQRGYAEAVRTEALRRCEAQNYLDDAAACEGYCLELIRKGFGPRAIRQRLAGRGFDGALIGSVLVALYPREVVRETARAVAVRKADQLRARYHESLELRARLTRYLNQRGFPADILHEVVAIAVNDVTGR